MFQYLQALQTLKSLSRRLVYASSRSGSRLTSDWPWWIYTPAMYSLWDAESAIVPYISKMMVMANLYCLKSTITTYFIYWSLSFLLFPYSTDMIVFLILQFYSVTVSETPILVCHFVHFFSKSFLFFVYMSDVKSYSFSSMDFAGSFNLFDVVLANPVLALPLFKFFWNFPSR